VECEHRWVNLRRVLDPRRAFQPAFRVTEISDDRYRSTIGVIVISLGTPRNAGENVGCTWEHLGAPASRLGAPVTCQGAPVRSLGVPVTTLGAPTIYLRAPATGLGAPRITVEQSGKKASSLGTPLVRLEIIATTYCSMTVKTHVFSLYSHLYIYVSMYPCIYISIYLCIYIATDLHTIYLDWLQSVIESNSWCAWKSRSSEHRDTLRGHDGARLEMH